MRERRKSLAAEEIMPKKTIEVRSEKKPEVQIEETSPSKVYSPQSPLSPASRFTAYQKPEVKYEHSSPSQLKHRPESAVSFDDVIVISRDCEADMQRRLVALAKQGMEDCKSEKV